MLASIFSGGGTYTDEETSHGSDDTCSNSGTDTGNGFETMYTVGDAVDAGFGSDTVTAHELDFSGGYFTIFYIDKKESPKLLHFGDDSGANDGSSSGKRPDTLADSEPREKQ